jgi:hypothetical protein
MRRASASETFVSSMHLMKGHPVNVRTLRQGPSPRFGLSPRLLFVALCGLAWTGFVLWLTIPWIDDIGDAITVPVAVALVVGFGIVPGVLNVHLISSLLFDDELERHPRR